MNRLALSLLATLLVPAALGAKGNETWVVNDSSGTVSIACTAEKPEVSLNGGSNTVTITGECTKIAVNGADNKVTIASVTKLAIAGSTNTVDVDAAGKIAVTGANNKVTWKRGQGNAAKPKVADLGTGNTVAKAK